MPSNYRGLFETGTHAFRPEWRATLNGKQIIIHISADGALWHWDNGQQTLCRSDVAREWAKKHVHKDDVENILLSCKMKEDPKDKSALSNIATRGSKQRDY